MVEDQEYPDISIVVATRNRPLAREMSLPLLLDQTLPPKEIFVVDSSDDPAPVRALVARLADQGCVPIEVVPSAPGLTIQRNVGLARVTSPIVVFPDDDPLLCADCLEHLARVYSADTEGVLAGVTVGIAKTSPLQGAARQPEATYEQMKLPFAVRALDKLRFLAEHHVTPIPYVYLRREIMRDTGKSLPKPVSDLGSTRVPDMKGCRMSFRTETIRQVRFNENLSGYSLGEDLDAYFGVTSIGMMARINKPLIYQHKFPGTRAAGYRWGLMQPLNIAYIGVAAQRGRPCCAQGRSPMDRPHDRRRASARGEFLSSRSVEGAHASTS